MSNSSQFGENWILRRNLQKKREWKKKINAKSVISM